MGVKEELRSGFLSASAYISLKGLAKFAVAEIGKIWVVDNELRKLERAVARIRGMIDCVEANRCFSGDNSKKAWQLWLEDLNSLSYVSGDFLEEVSTLLDNHTKSKLATDASSSLAPTTFTIPNEQPSLRSEILSSGKLDLPHKIVKLREMLEDLGDEMETLLNYEALKSEKTTKVVTYSGSTSLVDASLVVGREIQKAHIVAKLLPVANSSLSLISIIGMGGVGKTTLAQVTYNDNEVQSHFSRRIWVSISREFDVTRATRSIIEYITQQSCTLMDLESLQMKLRELLSFRRFLLILDDLWTENYTDLEVFLAPLRLNARGDRIIITTRSRIVSDMVGADPYLLPFLHDRDCWSLIRQRANVDNNVGAEENIDEVGLEMAKKCDGLPLAAKVLGKTLKDIHFKHWDKILKSNLWDLISCRDGIFSSLALSYYDLPRELKKCFVYCALFPANHKFEEENLVLLWLAEGLIQPMGERSLLCIGKQYFKDLVGRSFFYSNPEKKKNIYRMHGFFHQMARFISSDIFLQMEDESLARYPSLENIRHLSFFCGNLFSDDFVKEFPKCERLRTFLLICKNDVQGVGQRADYLLSKFDMLRVLDLSQGNITVLSAKVADLKRLRYLNLSGNPLKQIPEEIDGLFYLETLKFNRCIHLDSLPERLRNMKNLRHLQFYECRMIRHMPSEFAELANLQTLSTFVVGQGEGYTILELKKMAFLRGSLQVFRLENVTDENQVIEANLGMMLWLEELELEWTAPTDIIHALLVLVHIQFHENLKKLTIIGYYGLAFPQTWLRDSGFNLKSIHLKGCSLCLLLPALGHLQFLESLCIEKMPAVQRIETEFFEGFPSLKLLEFRNMVRLRRWSNLFPGCMPSLRVLICKECLSLVSLPSLGMLHCLTILKIKGCRSIMSLPEMLPVSLQKLDVRGSTMLEQGYAETQAENAQAEPEAQLEDVQAPQAEAQDPQQQPQAEAQLQGEVPEAQPQAELPEAQPQAEPQGEVPEAQPQGEVPEAQPQAELPEAQPQAELPEAQPQGEAAVAQAQAEAQEAEAQAPQPQLQGEAAVAQALEYWRRARAIRGLRIVASRPQMNEVAPAEI